MTNQHLLSRHEFLKASGIASIGLASAACGVPQPLATTPTLANTPLPTATQPASPHLQVSIPDTELWTLSSSDIGQAYSLFVALPHTYATVKSLYPVIYVLDANGLFGMASDTVRLLNRAGEVPEAIVVGIGYPVDNFIATFGFRTRDLTPTKVEGWYDKEFKPTFPGAPDDAGSGGAAQFLQFIRKEVMPYIDAIYRTSPGDNSLVGHSFGGLFALYALFNQSDAFRRYIIGSPATWWDAGMILDAAGKLAISNPDALASVFISAGADEDPGTITDIQKIVEMLQRKQSRRLSINTHIFEGEDHGSVIPAHISRGLRSAFA
jgi:uncharacterized protein